MQAFIGILSLDTRFPRIPGDAGHPGSYHLPARVRIVPGAESPLIVRDGRPSEALVAAFCAAAQALEAEGACLITSTCGFLVQVQAEIAASVRIPVLMSGLCLLPVLGAMTGGRPVGVLTADRGALRDGAIRAAGASPGAVRIGGLEDSALFRGTFLAAKAEQNQAFDRDAMEAEVVAAAQALVGRHPEIGAILFECGNLPPYAAAVAARTGRAVFSLLDAARLVAGPGARV
ncbi:aspartate/glutamate racemase family protein [Pseudooceanicola sp. CBS1P-1]|uniref:Aspartate/glutamate racemase family protein n=1 Tax=Pseudooceanicola albus TaxID=2692189 RepID=A0A6L7G5G7_9RHOB|nr:MULTISPECIES: aspartate/glutamate racemase family protein [Pseudooceanicola]MBT9385374.1 aspartate/glutamate racemase family protein [Pseudooceanicola endophyticus]MXN18767.1 aspartate/glutamate racemase family protein [Pseudooceanicola albus]